MELIKRGEIKKNYLPGRIIQNAVGKNSTVDSKKMTVSFACYSEESGPMEPHNHAEETVVVLNVLKGYVRIGGSKNNLHKRYELHVGDVMHFDELEWHVFEYEEGGFLDALCIYGQVDNIRPEEILDNK